MSVPDFLRVFASGDLRSAHSQIDNPLIAEANLWTLSQSLPIAAKSRRYRLQATLNC